MKRIITLALIITLFTLHYKIWLPENGLKAQYLNISKQAEILERQNMILQQENMILKAEIEDLQTGFQAVSEIARYKMGYIQDGEMLYKINQ